MEPVLPEGKQVGVIHNNDQDVVIGIAQHTNSRLL